MIITPLAPRAPYKALEAASFKIEKDSMSFGLIVDNDIPSKGNPSTTNNGSLLAFNEEPPLTLITASLPGVPD